MQTNVVVCGSDGMGASFVEKGVKLNGYGKL
jgi:hypothetical protein